MKISAAMIVKNEEKFILRCLTSLVGAVDEFIIIDTGSNDRTIEIIEDFSKKNKNVRLYHFEWINDFSAARNYSISKVTGDWVLYIDADEYLHHEDKNMLKDYCSKASTLKIPLMFEIKYHLLRGGEVYTILDEGIVRIFNMGYGLSFSGKIHEQLYLPEQKEANVTKVDIRIFHEGTDPLAIDMLQKSKRNISILTDELNEDITNSKYLMYLANELRTYDIEKAHRYYDLALKYCTNDKLRKWILHFKNK